MRRDVLAGLALAAAIAAAAEEPARPLEVKDGVGRTLTLKAPPRRIISLAPSVTEMLYALGAAGRIVGITDFCPAPPGPAAPGRIGGIVNPDLERILSLKPDLAVATTSGNYAEDRDRLERLGVPVFTCDTPDVPSVFATLESLGRLLGIEESSGPLAASLRARLEAVERRVAGRPRPRVLFLIWGEPILAPGRDAFITDALRRAGADSISASSPSRWAEYDLETILVERPEVILTVPDNRSFAAAIGSEPEWAPVPAVKNGRVHVVGDAIQHPGPAIVDGIEEIARLLHPE